MRGIHLMSILLTCDQMGPMLGNGGDWRRSRLGFQLSLYRMMQGIIVDGVTWESCRARVSPSIDTPSCVLRNMFPSMILGWKGKGLEGHPLSVGLYSSSVGKPGLYVSFGHVSWFEAQLERDLGLGYL